MQVSDGSATLRLSFVALTMSLAALFVFAVYWSSLRTGLSRQTATRHATIAAVCTAGWIAVTGVAAAAGVLSFAPPPTMAVPLVGGLVIAFVVGLSASGKRLALEIPMWALVGFQGFRVFVELLLHQAYVEGLMPVQMSYSGRNFDIISGVTAIALGAWLATGRQSPRLVMLWNVVSIALLTNIVVVALLSAPTPFRVFMNEPANVWITRAPWVWLPTVMVVAAIVGHILVTRRLLARR